MNNGDNFYQWSGIPSPEQNLRQGIVFFLQLFDAASAVGSSDPLATSNYFNITDIPTSSSSSAPASTSTRASSTSTLPTAPTSATTSTETSSSATSSATETSTPQPEDNSLAIGLGVGLGCALLLALLAAGFFYRRYRKRRSAAGRTQDLQAGREFDRGPYPFHGQDDGARYSELSGPDSSFQLHSDSVLPPPPQEKDGRSVQRIRPELE